MSQPTDDPKHHLTQPPELDSLEEATEMLTNQVSALSEALQTIAQVQADQVQLKQEVKAVKEDVQENAVPKHEFEAAQTETVQARQKLQTKIRIFAIGTACVALAVSLASGWGTLELTRHQRQAACEERNRQTLANSKKTKPFFEPFLAKEKTNPKADPVMVDLLSTIVNTPPQLTDCSKL